MYHNKINTKKLKPGLVASYDIWPGNGEGLFLFWHFINLSLTYLLGHLATYLQPRTHTGQLHQLRTHFTQSVHKAYLLQTTFLQTLQAHLPFSYILCLFWYHHSIC